MGGFLWARYPCRTFLRAVRVLNFELPLYIYVKGGCMTAVLVSIKRVTLITSRGRACDEWGQAPFMDHRARPSTTLLLRKAQSHG